MRYFLFCSMLLVPALLSAVQPQPTEPAAATDELPPQLQQLPLVQPAEPATPNAHARRQAVAESVKQYFEAMSARDAAAIREVVDPQFLAIEDGSSPPRVHLIDSAAESQLLPKNDDWEQVAVDEIDVQLGPSSSRVATVQFSLAVPLGATELAGLKKFSREHAFRLPAEQQALLAQLLRERQQVYRLHAMLVQRDNQWRIVCLSLPK